MNKKKGFTLVEMLATVVLIAIVALIATPSVLKVVKSSQKNAFLDSTTGLLEAAELYNVEHAGEITQLNLGLETELRKLKFKGTPPIGGSLYIDENGDLAVQMYDNRYCAIKNIYDKTVSVVDFTTVAKCKAITTYDKTNLILHYDGINNTGNGHDSNAKIWTDLSQNNNNGDLINFNKPNNWKNDSLEFNGIDNYLNLGNKLINLYKNSMTLEIVVNFAPSNPRSVILGNYPSTNSVNIERGYSVGQARIYYKEGLINYFTPNDYILSDKFQSYTFTLNKTTNTFNFFKNGIYKYQTISTNFAQNFDFINAKIGIDGRSDAYNVALKGNISSIRIYNRELNKTQIQQNYKVDENRFNLK